MKHPVIFTVESDYGTSKLIRRSENVYIRCLLIVKGNVGDGQDIRTAVTKGFG